MTAVGLDLGFEGIGGFGFSVVSTTSVGFGGHGNSGFVVANRRFGLDFSLIFWFLRMIYRSGLGLSLDLLFL